MFVYLSLMYTDGRVWHFFVADFTCLLHLLVHGLDVLVQVAHGQSLAAVRTLCTFIVMHLDKLN